MEPKERILASAEASFLRYGIRSISMDDIAAQLGMSKKTLYKFYADKDDLVSEVVRNHMSCIETDCNADQLTAKDAVHEIFIVLARMAEQYQTINPMVMHDLQKFHPRAFALFLKHKSEFLFTVIKNNIERGIKEGLYREDIDVEIMSRFRLEAMMMPLNPDVFPSSKFSFSKTSQIITENFIYGLATIKGHELINQYKSQVQINNSIL